MDEQFLQRLEHEFAGHDGIQALISAVHTWAWDAHLLETLTEEVIQAAAALDALQIPEGQPTGQHWHHMTLAERIQVLHHRMRHHIRQAQAQATATEQALTTYREVEVAGPRQQSDWIAELIATLAPASPTARLVEGQDAGAANQTGATGADELAEVHALLDAYGAPRVARIAQRADGSYQLVPGRAAERLCRLHRLMVESGMPDFMPPGTVIDSLEASSATAPGRSQRIVTAASPVSFAHEAE